MPDSASLGSAFRFEALPVAGWLLALDGRVLAANPVAAPLTPALPIPAAWAALVEVARRAGHATTTLPHPTTPGRTLQLVIALAEAPAGAGPQVHAIAVEVEPEPAAQRLESLGLVAGGIAHDFNNLLVGVLAEASAAHEDPGLADGTRDALRRIETAARRMAQLTRQLLAYAGRGQVVSVPVAADELLGELREALVRAVRPGSVLAVVPGASAVVVQADPGLLRQVVLALVANSSDAGAARIDVATRLLSRDGAPWWQLEVSDDGEGIEPANLVRLFEPFFTTRSGRHGLGLSAVHGIVRRLGGEVEVDAEPGRGARFRVRLPVIVGATAPAPAPATRRAPDPGTPGPRLSGVRVLVADDEPSVRATVRRLLERRGATVVVASDGAEAEVRLRDEAFDAIISDVAMPGRSGYDVLAVARATQPRVPVILMSGYTDRVRGEGNEEVPDVFLDKPFTAKILDAAVDDVLAKSGRRPPS